VSGRPVTPNPFTGKAKVVLVNEPLDTAELEAVRKVLERANANGPDEFGCYVVKLDGGGSAEVIGDDLQTGCMVKLWGMTSALSQFLYDLLKAGNWVMLPVMEDTVAITTSPGSISGIPDDFPKVVVCNSHDDLALLLTKGVRAWENYRDQIVGGGG
jgi:hypothetical protein